MDCSLKFDRLALFFCVYLNKVADIKGKQGVFMVRVVCFLLYMAFRVLETGKSLESVATQRLQGVHPLNAFDLLKGFETASIMLRAFSLGVIP